MYKLEIMFGNFVTRTFLVPDSVEGRGPSPTEACERLASALGWKENKLSYQLVSSTWLTHWEMFATKAV